MAKMLACLLSVPSPYNVYLYGSTDAPVASRKLSEIALNKLVHAIPELVGGSADLTGSNLTRWKGAVDFQPVHPNLPHLLILALHQTRRVVWSLSSLRSP